MDELLEKLERQGPAKPVVPAVEIPEDDEDAQLAAALALSMENDASKEQGRKRKSPETSPPQKPIKERKGPCSIQVLIRIISGAPYQRVDVKSTV